MRGRKENCGKSCVGEYCKQHDVINNIPLEIREKIYKELSEAIQNLPLEIRKKMYKEFVTIKLRERKEMGWNEVHNDIEKAPFCEKRSRITNVMICPYCSFIRDFKPRSRR